MLLRYKLSCPTPCTKAAPNLTWDLASIECSYYQGNTVPELERSVLEQV